MTTTTVITEHPAWHEAPGGAALRVVEHQGGRWLAHWQGAAGLTLRRTDVADPEAKAEAPPLARTAAAGLPPHPEAVALVDELALLGTVTRLTNPSLWDAITTAILRQVVRAQQARSVYRRWCAAYGSTIETSAGTVALTPGPEVVLGLDDEQFAAAGALFHRTALRAAARAYLKHGETWGRLDPDDLVKALDDVPGIGPWTASAAAADYTGDHAVYPYSDLAVRTWARRAAPDFDWPGSEREFGALWRRWAPNRVELHALTLFTLAWGSHARITRQPGGSTHRT
ncbi:hypothetical protein [Streptomyces sp. RKCA744]|uniref:hypothetical protein n=1 Tax=Streptomyces sp. RKCA744 TaxID=2959340 RepID=UPI00209DB3DF|nr:hypothetical protein [Streptomyces sp. RKCA744]